MYVLVGTWWIAGTVYLDLAPAAVVPGTKPLEDCRSEYFLTREEKVRRLSGGIQKGRREGKRSGRTKSIEGEYISQPFQRGLDIREFEEDGSVRDMLIVEHEADAPDNGREADVLGAGQVVQNDLGLGLGGHVVLCFNENLVEEI
jgi:hypothetical protein